MSYLASLIKLHTWELDAIQKQLAIATGELQKLQDEMLALDHSELEEQKFTSQQAWQSHEQYGLYIVANNTKRKELSDAILNASEQIKKIREELLSRFQDLKKYEHLLEKHLLELKFQQDKKEQLELDELTLTKFVINKDELN